MRTMTEQSNLSDEYAPLQNSYSYDATAMHRHESPPAALDLKALMSSRSLSTEIAPEEQKRMDVFHKGQISKNALKSLIHSIYEKIALRNGNKITMEMIKRYRRKLPQDESIQFVLEQLCRICTFCPQEMGTLCTFEVFCRLTCDYERFDGIWHIDEETKPWSVRRKRGLDSLESFYKVIDGVYQQTASRIQQSRGACCSSRGSRSTPRRRRKSKESHFNGGGMTVEDTLCIVLLLSQINDSLKDSLLVQSDRFAVSKVQFLKFVDPSSVRALTENEMVNIERSNSIEMKSKMKLRDQRILAPTSSPSKTHVYCDQYQRPESDGHPGQGTGIKWTPKARNANNLYITVLDAQQHFVTLGEVMQTINRLIQQALRIKCGDLTRIMNHLSRQMQRDDNRCKRRLRDERQREDKHHQTHDRPRDVQFEDMVRVDERSILNKMMGNTMANGDGHSVSPTKSHRARPWNKYAKNARLKYKFLKKPDFVDFTDLISEAEYRRDGHFVPDRDGTNATVSEVVLDNAKWFILKHREETLLDGDHDGESDNEVIEEKEVMMLPLAGSSQRKESKDEDRKAREEMFDAVLSFHADVITLQQLFEFAVRFALFLKRNQKLRVFLKEFERMTAEYGGDVVQWEEDEKNDFQKWLEAVDMRTFRRDYGLESKNVAKYKEEVQWVFDDSTSALDVCRKMNLFYPGGFLILKIHHFMNNTADVSGTYCLRLEEFGLWKHSLKINDIAGLIGLFLKIWHSPLVSATMSHLVESSTP